MQVFIWKESVYKRGIKCSCGANLWDKVRNHPSDNVGVDADKVNDKDIDLWCAKCGNLVGKAREMDDKLFDDEDRLDPLRGNVNDWIAKKEKQAEQDGRELAEKKAMVKLKNQIERLHQEVMGYESQIKHQKEMYERKIARKDKQIQELSKEITGLEARMKQMEKAMIGNPNKFTNMRDS